MPVVVGEKPHKEQNNSKGTPPTPAPPYSDNRFPQTSQEHRLITATRRPLSRSFSASLRRMPSWVTPTLPNARALCVELLALSYRLLVR